jgi:hypothetical protein
MNTADNVNRATQHLITVHGNAAENIALARAESATENKREDVAAICADSDEAAQAFRFDVARYSDMMSPRAWSLAGW